MEEEDPVEAGTDPRGPGAGIAWAVRAALADQEAEQAPPGIQADTDEVMQADVL